MKKGYILIIAIAVHVLSSCSTKFDLYCDDETTIIYAILDTEADTNFFKITKSFLGNALELSQDYEANNYDYDEIDVKFIGVFDDATQPDTIQLDTISKIIPYNENSYFYSGIRQRYYFTDRKLKKGETYKIIVNRKSDGETIWAQTKTTNTIRYIHPSAIAKINLVSRLDSVTWIVNDPSNNFHTTAAYYDVDGVFHYKELMPGSTDTTNNFILWNICSDKPANLIMSNSSYQIYYHPNLFFDILENNNYLRENSPAGVQRWIDKFELRISSVGYELYACHLSNVGNTINIDVLDYSNIRNGRGLMSSRACDRTFNVLSSSTIYRIINNYDYGFIGESNK